MIELVRIEDSDESQKYFLSHPNRGLFVAKFIKEKDMGYYSVTLTHSGYGGRFRRIAPCNVLFHRNEIKLLKYNSSFPVEM